MQEQDFLQLQHDLSNGVKRPECSQCWSKELLNLDYTLRDRDATQPLNVRFLELNLSSICNMKCRMCGPDSSSLWLGEHKHLISDTPVKEFKKRETGKIERAFASEQALFDYLNSLDLSNLEAIKVAGGEPFLQKGFKSALRYLIEKDMTHIEITILTNGSEVPDSYLELLNMFPSVDFRLSIEATGKLFSYVRGGAKYPFELITENLKKIQETTSFNISINASFTAYSAFNIANFFIWKQSIIANDKDYHSYPVSFPTYVAPQALPPYFRRKAFAYNMKVLAEHSERYQYAEHDIKRLLQFDHPFDESIFKNFLTYTHQTDLYRGEKYADLVPDLEFKEVLEDHKLSDYYIQKSRT